MSWLDGFGFAWMQPGDDVHFVELLLFECSAFGLHFAELLQGLQEAAGEALFIQGDGRDGVFRAAQGFGEGQGGVGFGVAGFDAVSVFFVAQGEQVMLGGGYAMETELEIGAGVGQLRFYGSFGLEGFEVALVNSL